MGYRKIIIVLISFAAFGVLVVAMAIVRKPIQQSPAQSPLPPTTITIPTSTSSAIQASSAWETKTYHNTKYGFEFQYPGDWSVKENSFGSYYSKFNMLVRPTVGWYSDYPFSVNVVLSEFPDRSFKNVEKTTSEAIVDGVSGIKYQYMFEGSQEIAIILPLREYKIILSTDDERYKDVFNQVISSFKFLK